MCTLPVEFMGVLSQKMFFFFLIKEHRSFKEVNIRFESEGNWEALSLPPWRLDPTVRKFGRS